MVNKIKYFTLILICLLIGGVSLSFASDGELKLSDEKSVDYLDFENLKTKSFDASSFEESNTLDFSLDLKSCCNIGEVKDWDVVDIDGLKSSTSAGEPQVPSETYKVKIPFNSDNINVKIESGEYVNIQNELDIAPTPEPLPLIKGFNQSNNSDVYSTNSQVYAKENFFPGELTTWETGKDDENKYVYIRFNPLQYNPQTKESILVKNAKIKVYYSISESSTSEFSTEVSGATIADESEPALIITPPSLYDQAVELADFHDNSRHLNATVVNTTQIYDNYSEASDPPYPGFGDKVLPSGFDEAEYNYSLAKRIINYTSSTDFEYITLFGDARLVPPSYYAHLNNYNTYNSWIPTDFFYASPDYDLTASAKVGRIPVNNSDEAGKVVDKIKGWSEATQQESGWFDNAALVGGAPFNTDMFVSELSSIDYVNKGYLDGMDVTKSFLTRENYNLSFVKSIYEGGYGFVRHLDHGSGEVIGAGTGRLGVDDMKGFDSTNKTPILMSDACMNGAFDTNVYPNTEYGAAQPISFGEASVIYNASAIAYLGGSRVNWGWLAHTINEGRMNYSQRFLGEIFGYTFESYQEGGDTIGNITMESLEKYRVERQGSGYLNRTILKFTLMGDPALKLPEQGEEDSYEEPNVTPIDKDGSMDAGDFSYYLSERSVPKFSLGKNETAELNISTNSTNVSVNSIELGSLDSTTSNLAVEENYELAPEGTSRLLIRPETPDGKEGWFYTYVSKTPDEVNLSLSGTSSVKEGETGSIYGSVDPVVSMNFTFKLESPNGTSSVLGSTTTDSYGRFYYSFDTEGYEAGDYEIHAMGRTGDLNVSGTLQFSILDYDELELHLLSSKNFDSSECEGYGFKDCKIWPVETNDIINSSNCEDKGDNCRIVDFSESGVVHFADINVSGGGERRVAVVDSDVEGEYDMVFIDDDETFMEDSDSEINVSERSFLEEGSTTGSVNTVEGESIDIKLSNIAENGSSILMLTKPASGEIPYQINDEVNFVILAEGDGNPKEGIDVTPKYYSMRERNELETSTTNNMGLSDSYNFTPKNPGRYMVRANNEYLRVLDVEPPFELEYGIKDASTGESKNTFKPGDEVKVEFWGVMKDNGNLVELDEEDSRIKLWKPSGLETLDIKKKDNKSIYYGTYEIKEEDKLGEWEVSITGEADEGGDVEEGIEDYSRGSFKVKSYKVMTMPMDIEDTDTSDGEIAEGGGGGGGSAGAESSYPGVDGFAPNEKGHIMVLATELGTIGGYDDVPELYPIDDPNTTTDECKNYQDETYFGTGTPWAVEWGNVKIESVRKKGGEELNTTGWNITNVKNSDLYETLPSEEHLPDNLMHQCVIEFETPVEKNTYLGDVKVTLNDEIWESGDFKFDIRTIKASAYPWNPGSGWRRAFSPGGNASLKIEARDLYNQKDLEGENIVDAKLTQIEVMGNTYEAPNQSFHKNSTAAWVEFTAPNKTGHYRVDFMVEAQINRSGNLTNETGYGDGYFSVEMYQLRGITEKWRYGTNQSVPIEVEVTNMMGNGEEGLNVEIDEIRNWETDENYLDEVSYESITTNSSGKGTINLIPNGTWDEGNYNVRLKATDKYGNSEEGWAWFDVQDYDVDVYMEVGGERTWRDVVKGKELTFITNVREVGKKEVLGSDEYSVSMNKSVLKYFGKSHSKHRPDKIRLSSLNVSVFNSNEGKEIIINTDQSKIKAGNYNTRIGLKVDGDTTYGDEWLEVKLFESTVEPYQETYGPGDNVTMNVSVSSEGELDVSEFNVSVEDFVCYSERERTELSISNEKTIEGGQVNYSFNLPEKASGWCSGEAKITKGDEEQEEDFHFEVKSLILGPPKSYETEMYSELENESEIQEWDEEDEIKFGFDEVGCSRLRDEDITLPDGIINNTCTLFNSTLVEDDLVERNDYWVLIDTTTETVYVDSNKNFTDGNVTYNSTRGDSFTDKEGVVWKIMDVYDDQLKIESSNALGNGIKVDLSLSKSGKFMFEEFNETRFGDWGEDMDLNDNGKLESIYLLSVDTQESGKYDQVFVGYNFSGELNSSDLKPQGTTFDLGKSVYVVELVNIPSNDDVSAYLAVPELADYYELFETRKPGSNVSFPVMTKYPNGTPKEGANVSINKIIKDKGIEEKEVKSKEVRSTNSDGLAIFSYNLTESADYTFVMESAGEIMDEYDSPDVDAEWFDVDADKHSRLGEVYEGESFMSIRKKLDDYVWRGNARDEFGISEYENELTLNENTSRNVTLNDVPYQLTLENVNTDNINVTLSNFEDYNESDIMWNGSYEDFYISYNSQISVYVEGINETPNSTTPSARLSVGLGRNLDRDNLTIGGKQYNFTIIDDPNHIVGLEDEKEGEITYDTLLAKDSENVTALRLGDELDNGYYLSKIYDEETFTLVNGSNSSLKLKNLPRHSESTGERPYWITEIDEEDLDFDLNGNDRIGDKLWSVAYKEPWSDENNTNYTDVILDDDRDFYEGWKEVNDTYLDMDYGGEEKGMMEEEEDNLPLLSLYSYQMGIDSDVEGYFDTSTMESVFLKEEWSFGVNEDITMKFEAEDYGYDAVEGVFNVTQINTWDENYDAVNNLEVNTTEGVGILTISPSDFNLTSGWPSDGTRVVGNFVSGNKKEVIDEWVSIEDTSDGSDGGSGGGGSTSASSKDGKKVEVKSINLG